MKFIVRIKPKAIQSVRKGKNKFFQPKKNVDYKNEVARQVKEQLPKDYIITDDAISVYLAFIYEYPKTKPKTITKEQWQKIKSGELLLFKKSRPDILSNLEKGTIDALNGIVWEDDSNIVAGKTLKMYGRGNCVTITIEKLDALAV